MIPIRVKKTAKTKKMSTVQLMIRGHEDKGDHHRIDSHRQKVMALWEKPLSSSK